MVFCYAFLSMILIHAVNNVIVAGYYAGSLNILPPQNLFD
jgi:hypothetical protein